MEIKDFKEQYSNYTEEPMPVLFVGHGNPMNAIEDNEFSRGWSDLGKKLPLPKAILCISAHWQTRGTRVTATKQPETIHDFGGFPKELFEVEYAAPGSPEFAEETRKVIKKTSVALDHEWGLDHGCWSVLCKMYPDADIPTFQLSLDYYAAPELHYAIAGELKELRKKGVLIVGSGNMVHNLRLAQWNDTAFDWAVEFDTKLKTLIEKGDHASIIHYQQLGREAQLSIPTNEHYLPLLYTLALQSPKDELEFFNEKTIMGSISMRSLKVG